MARPELTAKQKQFAREYLIDLNATQAAIRAGYSKNGAKVTASQTLTKPNVQKYLRRLQEKRSKRVNIKSDDVLRELIKLGFSNMDDYMVVGHDGNPSLDFGSLNRDQKAALAEVTVDTRYERNGEDGVDRIEKVKFKLYDKRAALVDIGKHLGMFVKKVEDVSKRPLTVVIE